MLEAMVFSYGMLTSFVLTGAERNRRAQRANPRMLEYVGYALCGSLATFSACLTGYALLNASALG